MQGNNYIVEEQPSSDEVHLPVIHGRLLRRYKRFLADVILDDGTEVLAHCTRTGRSERLEAVRQGVEF